jgi:hypothetical protein
MHGHADDVAESGHRESDRYNGCDAIAMHRRQYGRIVETKTLRFCVPVQQGRVRGPGGGRQIDMAPPKSLDVIAFYRERAAVKTESGGFSPRHDYGGTSRRSKSEGWSCPRVNRAG